MACGNVSGGACDTVHGRGYVILGGEKVPIPFAAQYMLLISISFSALALVSNKTQTYLNISLGKLVTAWCSVVAPCCLNSLVQSTLEILYKDFIVLCNAFLWFNTLK